MLCASVCVIVVAERLMGRSRGVGAGSPVGQVTPFCEGAPDSPLYMRIAEFGMCSGGGGAVTRNCQGSALYQSFQVSGVYDVPGALLLDYTAHNEFRLLGLEIACVSRLATWSSAPVSMARSF